MAAYQWRQRWETFIEPKYYHWGHLDYRVEAFRAARLRHKGYKNRTRHMRKMRAWSLFFVLLSCTVALLYYLYLGRLIHRFEHAGRRGDQEANVKVTERRAILPHARWVDYTDRWRQAYPGKLHVFSAFYYYRKTYSLPSEAPPVVVLGLASSCSYRFEARVVYQDYPHSFKIFNGRCRCLEESGTNPLKAVALEFRSNQAADREPVSISVIVNGKDSQVWLPVRSTVLPATSVLPSNTIGVCTRVDQEPNVPLLVEFLAFHRLLGVSRFEIYTAEDLPRNLTVRPTAVLRWDYTTLLRNVSSAYTVLVHDCIHRSRPHVEYVLILDPNEFFVPGHQDIQSVTRSLPKADVYKMTTATFCDSNSSVRTRRVLETQSKFRRSNNSFWKPTLFRCRGDGREEALVPQSAGIVHKYNNSEECIAAGYTDDTAKRFAVPLLESQEIRQFLSAGY